MEASKTYFASDFHLGVPTKEKSVEREIRLITWMEGIKKDAKRLFLVGDLFDFWHDYKTVVPKGHVAFLAKIQELVRHGVEVTIFTGNHDLWMFGYFQEELGAKVLKGPLQIEIDGKRFYIAHGDGLGPGDHGYKFIKKVFTNKICQWLFHWIHPDLGIGLANYFSKKSRDAEQHDEVTFLGEDREWLVIHSKEMLEKEHFDFFVYGHRHYPIKYKLTDSVYINLGDWLNNNTFGEFDGDEFLLKRYLDDGTTDVLPYRN